MRCAIWYHLYNLKNVKAPMEECYFPMGVFAFFKLCK